MTTQEPLSAEAAASQPPPAAEPPRAEVAAPASPSAEADLELAAPWEIPGWDNQAQAAAADIGDMTSSAPAEEKMELAETWEFIGWQGNPDIPQKQIKPWESIYGEETLELAERPPSAPEAPSPGSESVQLESVEAPVSTAPADAALAEAAPGAATQDAASPPVPGPAAEPPAAAHATEESSAADTAATRAPSPPPSDVSAPEQAALVANAAAAPTLEQTVGALSSTTRSDLIGSTLFDFCRGRFERVLLLAVRYGTAMVVRGMGEGAEDPSLAALRIDLAQPSAFSAAANSRSPQVLSAPTSEQELQFFAAFPTPPLEGAILPVVRGGELMDLLYVDCGSNPLPESTLDELARLALAAAEAHARTGPQA